MKALDNDEWIKDNFGGCDLGDVRRTKRLVRIAGNMLSAPEKSLTEQNVSWSDVKAAYRFFSSEHSTFEKIAEQHWQQTRNTTPGRYLLISDTTDVDHTFRNATTGLGMLGNGKGRGIQVHHCLMYDCDQGQVRGAAGGLVHYRKRKPKNETRMQRLSRVRESDVWGTLVDQIGPAPQGSQWTHVFDRGGDQFEAMCRIHLMKNAWIIRASRLARKVLTDDRKKVRLDQVASDARELGSYELNLRSRVGVPARTAKLTLSVVSVTFPRPSQYSPWVRQSGIQELKMNVVVVQEVDSPKSAKPICWLLLTSLDVKTFEDAWQVVEDYEQRWLIEEYHKAMKSGCSLEIHALRAADRLEPLIGLISVIGVRLFQLKLIGRNQREARAATHVPRNWLKCLKLARPKTKIHSMTVYSFFRELAKMGGFLARTADGEPGWQTIWRGFQKLQSILDAMKIVAPNSIKSCG